ncbi:MAG: cytochrome b [Rhodospirillales bacterium]|jgi:ubiquinol-cytochrome c reductase cytochrome b subunit
MTSVQWKNPVVRWVDSRFPVFSWLHHEYNEYPMPRNCNYLWSFGAISMVMLVTMILTGLFLAMHYTASTTTAFTSVERIMRDVNYGWLIRYVHMNGASFFFIAVYIHIFRGLYYGSYKQPREILWMIGVVIMLLMMATAFMGYVLPWGQMSFWGATVITNLFSAIPLVGEAIVTWLWGGFSVDNATLNRFFALHFVTPFVIFGVVVLHVAALHAPGVGSNNPRGIDMKGPQDAVPFNPYMTVKDSFAIVLFLIVFLGFTFYVPNYLGHPDNYIPANPLVTPPHIVPEWYFLPFYAILRAINFNVLFIDAKLGGVIAMFGAIAVLFVLPFIDRHPVRSARYRPLYRKFFWILVANVIVLGWVGAKPAEQPYVAIGQVATFWYFFHFLVILPWLNFVERPDPLPTSIAEPVLKGGGRLAAGAATAKPMEKA